MVAAKKKVVKKVEKARESHRAVFDDGVKRVDSLSVDPEELVIIGGKHANGGSGKYDTDHTRRRVGASDTDPKAHVLFKDSIFTKLDQDTVDTMKTPNVGVVEQIQVRRDGGKLVVVNGRTRVRHAREANKQLLAADPPCKPVRVLCKQVFGDDGLVLGISIVANEHRRQPTVIEKARDCAAWLALGYSPKDAGTQFKVDVQTIRIWLHVLETIPAAQQAVDEGKLSAAAVSQWAVKKLSEEEQSKRLEEALLNGGTSAKAERHKAALIKDGKPPAAAIPVPGRRLFKKLFAGIDGDKEIKEALDPAFIQGVKWATGEIPAEKVKGLVQALRASGAIT